MQYLPTEAYGFRRRLTRPRNWNRWRRDNWRLRFRYPFITWANTWFNAPCASWHAPPGKPVRVDGGKLPPILLLTETLDAATPFSGSLEARRRCPRAILIATRGGTTHANSLAGNACVDDRVAAYLADGTLPTRLPGNRPDVVRAPLPQPEPEVQAASASAGGGAARAAAAAAAGPALGEEGRCAGGHRAAVTSGIDRRAERP